MDNPHDLAAQIWPGPTLRSTWDPEEALWDPRQGVDSGSGHRPPENRPVGLLEALPEDLRQRLRPSALREHARCGVWGQFRREWEPRHLAGGLGEPWPKTLLGTMLHYHMRGILKGHPIPEIMAGRDALAKGLPLVDCLAVTNLADKVAIPVLKELHTWLERGETPISIEEKLGVGTPDLITSLDETVVVTDYKSHLSEKSQRYVDEWQTDVQLWAYALETHLRWGRVDWIRVCEIYVQPRPKCLPYLIKVTPEALMFQRGVIRDLTADVIRVYNGGVPQARTSSCWKMPATRGKCLAFDACHTYQWDVQRMETLYQRRTE